MDDDQLLAFQSTPLMRGETVKNEELKDKMSISIHSPHARGDQYGRVIAGAVATISIHSPHARGDEELLDFIMRDCNFNPLPSCEGRRRVVYATSYTSIFQSTPLMRGETSRLLFFCVVQTISIHSPHARGDKCFHDPLIGRPISIHSPHARGDNSAAFIRNSALISIHSPHARGDSP